MNPTRFSGTMVILLPWQHESIIRATHPQIQEIMGSNEKYYSFTSFFRDIKYILQDFVESVFHKNLPQQIRQRDHQAEKGNICYGFTVKCTNPAQAG
jgi:hypothetical protein